MGWIAHHFSPSGDPLLHDPEGTRMNVPFILKLDAMREEVGRSFVVTDGWRPTERQAELVLAKLSDGLGSAHPRGEAVDGYFVGLPLLIQCAYAIRWGFSGVGLYPHTTPPILHLDVMTRSEPQRMALWIRTTTKKYVYAPSPEFARAFLRLASPQKAA